VADVITLQDDTIEPGKPATFHHPSLDTRRFTWMPCGAIKSMLVKVMEGGHRLGKAASVDDIRARRIKAMSSFDHTYLRFLNPHLYKVAISPKLRSLKLDFVERYQGSRSAGS
jgi:nicotinate phosphoribosyltransferase